MLINSFGGVQGLQGALRVYRCVEGAGLANDNRPDLAAVAGAGEVAEGILHLGEQAHAGGAAGIRTELSSLYTSLPVHDAEGPLV